MSIETKQCSVCVDAPPYRDCLTLYGDKCAYVVSLQAALREALDGWYAYSKLYFGTAANLGEDRILALRAQFLDDK